jgi:hypothetical protein
MMRRVLLPAELKKSKTLSVPISPNLDAKLLRAAKRKQPVAEYVRTAISNELNSKPIK